MTNGRNNNTDKVVEQVRQEISTGKLRPNQRLVELEIAEKLGISRTPVREALRILETEGYLNRRPHGGLTVTDYSIDEIRDICEVREALESMAFKLACERATEEQINRVIKMHEHILEVILQRDSDKFLELNTTFHNELLIGCGNEQLMSLIRSFRMKNFQHQIVRVFSASDWRRIPKQHQHYVDALQLRSPRLAQKAVHENIEAILRNFTDSFLPIH
jgi:DNA-binding GntR family transcriptional regulator